MLADARSWMAGPSPATVKVGVANQRRKFVNTELW